MRDAAALAALAVLGVAVALATDRVRFAVGCWICSIRWDGHTFGPWKRMKLGVEFRVCRRCPAVETRSALLYGERQRRGMIP